MSGPRFIGQNQIKMADKNEKYRRMEIRKEIGNREVSPPQSQSSPGVPNYLFPYVCFACRKSFKRSITEEGLPDKTCPNCGGVAHGMSRKFKPPAAKDTTQWDKVEFLFQNGYRFFTQHDENGQCVPYPKTIKEAKAFVLRFGKGYFA